MRLYHFFAIFFTLFALSCASPITASTEGSVILEVLGNVPTRPQDIILSLTADYPAFSTVSQEQVISYTLNYSSISDVDTIVTITTRYSALAPDGSGEQLLDYVSGSATSINSGIPGLINQQQKTISWQQLLIPAHATDQKLFFQLKSNSRFPNATQDVLLNVSAAVTSPFITPSVILPIKYQYNLTLIPPIPTATPIPPPQSLVTKTVNSTTTVRDLVVTQLNNRSITLEALANPNSNLRVLYGTSPKQLKSTINSISQTGMHQFKISNLKTDTIYYFQFQYAKPDGSYAILDTYTFRTPNQAEELELNKMYQLSAQNSQGYIFNGKLFAATFSPPIIVLPQSSKLTFNLQHDPNIPMDMAQVLLYSPDLKIPTIAARSTSTQSSAPSTATTDLIAIRKQLDFPNLIGNYTLKSRLRTQKGTIAESTIAEVKIIKPITIRHHLTGAPISNAKVSIYKYDATTDYFYAYPDPNEPPLELYSESNGGVPFVPQNGRFRLVVERVPFYLKNIDLTVQLSQTMVLPDIELRPSVVGWAEPIIHILSNLQPNRNYQKQSFQEWLNQWSEAIIGRALFPIETQALSTTESF